jgi:hypothetical protein
MKRYISSILIPCLLLQLFGCYSYRAITIDQLKQYQGENNIRILTDSSEIIINRNISGDESMNWNSTDSSILIDKMTLKSYMDTSFAEQKKMEITYSKIGKAEIEEVDYVKTTILSVLITVIAFFVIAGIVISQNGVDLGLHGNW